MGKPRAFAAVFVYAALLSVVSALSLSSMTRYAVVMDI